MDGLAAENFQILPFSWDWVKLSSPVYHLDWKQRKSNRIITPILDCPFRPSLHGECSRHERPISCLGSVRWFSYAGRVSILDPQPGAAGQGAGHVHGLAGPRPIPGGIRAAVR